MDLRTEISSTFDDMINTFSAFSQSQVDTVPFEGSWTAGQVAEHVTRSLKNLPIFLGENVEPTTRQYDEHCTRIRTMFSNYEHKMKSPDFIVPTETRHDTQAMLDTMQFQKAQMLEAASLPDLTVTCKTREMTHIGYMTRFEWLTFYLAHTQRHTHQMKNILATVTA
ncbi:MAG: DinB family protein [Flavipsychrobacter sp.]|nr:DinB family protein [Flavipsychrobacter sp.]